MIALALAGLALAGDAGREGLGGADPGRWTAGVQAGLPWQTLRLQRGLAAGVSPVVEYSGALLVENRLSAGLALRIVHGARLRLSGEVVAGGLVRAGDLAYRGPSASARLRVARNRGQVWPWLGLSSRHTAVFDRTTLSTIDGDEVSWSVGHRWTPGLTAGLGISPRMERAYSFGIDWPWLDPPGLSLPGLFAAVTFGWGP